MEYDEVISRLESLGDPARALGMARYGINSENALGVSMPALRKTAGEIGKDHDLAALLWDSGIHEARILACLIEEPSVVTASQADAWVEQFDSWDICDQCCMNLFWQTPFAYDKCFEWAGRGAEFAKRAGFALIARIAWSDKSATDEQLISFLPLIKREATDERNFVKKAVNWALRQIGKRNAALNALAIETSRELKGSDSSSARWIGSDALRELQSAAVQKRLGG
jgi:3-methyladenine DNA glycosylase AlkD